MSRNCRSSIPPPPCQMERKVGGRYSMRIGNNMKSPLPDAGSLTRQGEVNWRRGSKPGGQSTAAIPGECH
jgi:hypothetical protein